jgi:hypothetical protein
MNGMSKNILNKTANLSKIIEKIGGGNKRMDTSPRGTIEANESVNKSLFLAINHNLGPSIEGSMQQSP